MSLSFQNQYSKNKDETCKEKQQEENEITCHQHKCDPEDESHKAIRPDKKRLLLQPAQQSV